MTPPHRITVSPEALNEICRAVADRGEDYGWNVYRKGYTIPAAARSEMVAYDENATAWLEAYDASTAAYRAATGEDWKY